jgi:hypothetical protein
MLGKNYGNTVGIFDQNSSTLLWALKPFVDTFVRVFLFFSFYHYLQSFLGIHGRLVADTKIHRCSHPLYKVA